MMKWLNFMDTKTSFPKSQPKKTIAIEWDAQEWFEVWLRLSREAKRDKTKTQTPVPQPH
jgi:hypothetical protein